MDFSKLATFIDPLSGIINSALSIVKDKTKDADMSFIQDKVKNGVSISSKRMLNLVGTGAMLTVALSDIATNGISWEAVGLCALGAAYSAAMAYLTKNS